MRDHQIIALLTDVTSAGPLSSHFARNSQVVGIGELRGKLIKLSAVPGFASRTKKFEQSAIYDFARDTARMDPELHESLFHAAQTLDLEAKATLDFLTAQNGDEQPDEVLVKLPPLDHLGDVADFCKQLDLVITQALAALDEAPIANLKGWESGSLWLEISVGSVPAVVAIGGLAWAAAVAYKKLQEGRLLAKNVEAMGVRNEFLDDLRQKTVEAVAAVIDTEAKRLRSAYRKGNTDDPESIERLKFCIKEMSSMIEKGAEVHPALSAPENVKNLFPDLSNILALPEIVPLLTAAKGTED